MDVSNVVQRSPYLSAKQTAADHEILVLKKQNEAIAQKENQKAQLIDSVPKVQADGKLGSQIDKFA